MVLTYHIAADKDTFVSNTVFQNCYSSMGGAIFLDSSSLSFFEKNCNFLYCKSDAQGGAITIKNCQQANISHSCYLDNESPYGQGFIIWSAVFTIIKNSVNLTSERNDKESYHSSCFGGESQGVHFNNNISHCKNSHNMWLFQGASTCFKGALLSSF